MWNRIGRWIAPGLMTLGALGGLAFAWSSTLDYSRHLDRQVHDLRCGFVPGLAAAPGADEGCRAAIYSPYAALFRDRVWGGVPVSLFAVGAFSFFVGFALYLLLSGRNASKQAVRTGGLLAVGPFVVSLVMAYLSATRLGTFCKTCMGIYFSSTLLFLGGLLGILALRRETTFIDLAAADASGARARDEAPRAEGQAALVLGWLALLGATAVGPAFAYARNVPNHDEKIGSCGTLAKPLTEKSEIGMKLALTRVTGSGPRTPVTLMVDPLCPSCRALHRRLDAEGFLEQMDTTVLLFPLDSSCNWMVDRDVHPGACLLAKAMICAHPKGQAGQVLEWSYDQQEHLLTTAKTQGGKSLEGYIEGSFPGLSACMKEKATGKKLEEMLRFAVENRLPVSTPQLFLGELRMCDEDTDMGLVYSIRKLVPQLKARSF
ncbi:MAG: hypothetical protein FJ096_17950 [Deltaproteobacteria bacterium]|nr:hypothetical protein [Deltaproteobacteria bacterium]